jgi:RHS repeat-associated protein
LRGTIVLVLVTATALAPCVAEAVVLEAASPRAAAALDAATTVFAYSYDAGGNLKARSDGTRTDTFEYDFEGRLVAADVQTGGLPGPVSFTYDADGIRTGKAVGGVATTYLTDRTRPIAQVLVENAGGVETSYTLGDDRIAIVRPGLGARFYQRDGQHSIRQLTDAAGAVTDSYTYDAFGVLLASAGSTPNEFLYTGEQLDPNVGFYYLRARYYAQALGRFITPDPLRGSIFDPVSLHRYLYASADPVNRHDPTGETSLLIERIIVGIIVGTLVGLVGLAVRPVIVRRRAFDLIAANSSMSFFEAESIATDEYDRTLIGLVIFSVIAGAIFAPVAVANFVLNAFRALYVAFAGFFGALFRGAPPPPSGPPPPPPAAGPALAQGAQAAAQAASSPPAAQVGPAATDQIIANIATITMQAEQIRRNLPPPPVP